MNKLKYLFIITAAVFLFILPKSVFATTVAPASISTDTVWTASASPYLMAGVTRVEVGATLTVEAGTVVKSTRFGALEVAGNLRVQGTSSTPVIFTSYNDDTVGGDTNADGATSAPAGGDWLWLKFLPDSSGEVSHAEFRYGGYEWRTGTTDGQIIVDGASPTVRNVRVRDGHVFGRCVRLTNSSAQVLDSDLSGSYECVRIEGGAPVLRGNSIYGAGYSGIAVTADLLSGQLVLRDNRIYENANYGLVNTNAEFVDARLNRWNESDVNPSSSILGNILYDPWIGKTREPVVLIPGIMGSWQKRGEWAIDPILHTYDNLLDALRAEGYVDGQTLFTFPYDWKISNVLTAHYLKEKLEEVRAVCGCSRVDLVAHSMGGLVARQYISSNEYADDVDQVIFLGTPHRGAPKDYLAWEAGEFGPTIFDKAQKLLFQLQAIHSSYSTVFNYIHNYPISTVRELLPVYNYLRNASDDRTRQYPVISSEQSESRDLYPTNPFLETLNSEEKLTNLENTHVRFTNIVGDTLTNETINMLRVLPSIFPEPVEGQPMTMWQHGEPENYNASGGDHGLELGSGDNTVPLASATHFNVNGTEELTLNSDHSSLPTSAQEEILEKLTGNVPSSSITTWRIPNTFLLVRLFSPIDAQIITPSGARVGKNFETNEEISEIPWAFYSGFDTENEFIVIPNPEAGEYRVETQGTGAGEYRVVANLISELVDGQSSEIEFSGTATSGIITETNLLIDPENLVISADTDHAPPTITITSPTNRDYTRAATVSVEVEVADDSCHPECNEGSLSTQIRLDDIIINSTTIDTFFLPLGSHQFSVTATDLAGNTASSMVQFRLVATLESAISDVTRAHALGWINQRNRDSIARRLNNIIRVRNQIDSAIRRFFGDNVSARIVQSRNNALRSLVRGLLADLRIFRSLNTQAQTLIREDLNWLINNLSF